MSNNSEKRDKRGTDVNFKPNFKDNTIVGVENLRSADITIILQSTIYLSPNKKLFLHHELPKRRKYIQSLR